MLIRRADATMSRCRLIRYATMRRYIFLLTRHKMPLRRYAHAPLPTLLLFSPRHAAAITPPLPIIERLRRLRIY